VAWSGGEGSVIADALAELEGNDQEFLLPEEPTMFLSEHPVARFVGSELALCPELAPKGSVRA
jgi:hypothetical protein